MPTIPPLTIPTLEELLRTKAFLLYARGYTRDFVDCAALSQLLPDRAVVECLADLDAKFGWEKQPSVLLGVMKALLHAQPADFETHGFASFRWLAPRLTSWEAVRDRCRVIGEQLSNSSRRRQRMKHRHIVTSEWTRMAIESLFDRSTLADWREFAAALAKDPALAERALAVGRYREPDGAERIAAALIAHVRSKQAR